jgi:hypothetical protein
MEKKDKNVRSNVGKMNVKTSEQIELKNFILVILVVVICVAGLYLVTRAFVTKDLIPKEEEEVIVAGEVNYDVAIMGQLLNRPYKQYYAVIYDSEGDYSTDMYKLVYAYVKEKDAKHIYTIDLSNELNKAYYDKDNVKKNATKVSEMKVGDITLVKVKNGKIDKYIVDYAKMQKELGVEVE